VAAQHEGARPNEQWAPALQQRGLREEARLEDRGAMLGTAASRQGCSAGRGDWQTRTQLSAVAG
jgi:hypothetical protein